MSDLTITPQEMYQIGLREARELDQLLTEHGKNPHCEKDWVAKWGKYA